jgi:hypothetical protein
MEADAGREHSTNGEKITTHVVLVWKPEGQRLIRTLRLRWEDNIKIDLTEIGWGCSDWSDLAQDRDQWRTLVNTVIKLRVQLNVGKFLSNWAPMASQELICKEYVD